MARRVIGSSSLQISTANQEIVPPKPEGWTVPITFKTFSFMNTQACRIVLNGKSKPDGTDNIIYLREYQGISLSESDIDVSSFVILDDGIEFNWVGKF